MIEQLKDSYKTFESQLNGLGQGFWQELRTRTLHSFSGLPKPKDEEYRYTQLGRILDKKFQFADLSMMGRTSVHGANALFHNADAHHIYINNGVIDQSKVSQNLPKGLSISTLQEALHHNAKDIESHLGKYAIKNNDAFASLNTIFSYEGIFIKVDKNVQIDKPILLHYSGTDHPGHAIYQSRSLILAEPGARLSIVESYSSDHSEDHFSNHVSEIVVGANALLDYYKLQNQSASTYHVDNTFITQSKDSVVKSYVFTLEGKIIRNNLNVDLEDENCETHMFGLYVAHGDNHIDNHTVVDHKMPHCFSNEIYKGILDDTAKAVFNGKIFVRPNAQKTNAFQSNKNILLTDTASMNSKPQLEIWADDVKCSHGCTTGQLDDEQMFYLRSRGISKASARAMLLHAFVDDVLDKISIGFLHDFVAEEMKNRLD
ncbi:MAG: Fe-S cluster assembly protein SufD [Cyclobacteriaceae bacterium]|nr:Fe-S cluster assembly protein SufD [Cyclobacteriaceae bacterium]